ncbi:YhgE/Pip family protein [Galbitalea soli]|uniref:ABC transporter permease n=1 Tax=Galbitalea soli TaxID=1268042 RepID=A0A7C9PL07_9MICO|nr:YhgE/Pip family protein [Galbitalea soli]NEM89749.1 ABC transporter permease [Galbitalea soli]NYJ30450.1 putative membrane protein [Galbitalea soli]
MTRLLAFVAVALVPLAFAGLVVAAVSPAKSGVDRIPAAIVDNDQLVTQTAADGTKTPILAGRQLVTELTGAHSAGFSWTITNSKDAKAALASGTVAAILTVPKDFSRSIVSLSTTSPVRASIQITTDDSHNYLVGSVAQVVGDSLTSAFGSAITEKYLAGVYSSIGGIGGSFAQAADGATKLSDGAGRLSTGLTKLADGIGQTQAGASSLAGGVGQYVGGVSSLAGGLDRLSAGATTAKTKLVAGVGQYTGGVSTISAQLTQAVAALTANPTDPVAIGTVNALTAALAQAAQSGPSVVAGVNTAMTGLGSGIAQTASGAHTLASSGASLSTGTRTLAAGIGQLQTGATRSASGATALQGGATTLATGLEKGATSVPSYTSTQSAAAAKVVAKPVSAQVTRNHKVTSVPQIISTLFVPLGLWIGALAVFLVSRRVSRRTLSSTVAPGRIVLQGVARASGVTLVQAALLVLLLHTAAGVSWTLLPATLSFAVVMALAFTAFHHFLTLALGRTGLIVSILLLAVQLTSTGGLYPVQLLAAPFQAISPFLPLSYGVRGMQAIIAGGSAGTAVAAAGALAAFGLASLGLSLIALRRVRRARSLGLVPTGA